MRTTAPLLLLLLAFQITHAQTSAVLALDWARNPVTVVGNAPAASATVGGVAIYNQQRILAATRYENHDTTWMTGYHTPNFELACENMQHDRPGTLTFAGFAADSNGYAATLVRIDSLDGTLQWAKRYHIGASSTFNGSVQTPNGSLAYGKSVDPSQTKGMIAELNPADDTLWTSTYAAGRTFDFIGAHPLGSGCLMVGNYVAMGAAAAHVFLMRIDGGGNPVWTRQYSSERSEMVEASTMDADGNLYMAITSNDTTQQASAMRLMSTDSAGNFRFGTSLTIDRINESRAMLLWPGEGIFLAGTIADNSPGPNIVARLDSQGQFQWAKSYLPVGYVAPTSITRFGDHGLLVAMLLENPGQEVALMEMDSSGTLQSPCTFAAESPVVTSFTPVAQQLTVTRTRGCTIENLTLTQIAPIVSTQQVCFAVGTPEPQNQQMKVFPQPMTDHAEIEVPDGDRAKTLRLEVQDMYGHIVQLPTTKTANGLRLHRGELPAGLYTCRLSAGTTTIATVRIVLQ
jgi:hypothetical protein